MKSKIGVLVFFILLAGSLDAKVPVTQKIRLTDNWEFLRQDLGSIWEAVRPVKAGQPETVPLWSDVSLPHCFNAEDAVDPDVNYYQGPGWYRTLLKIDNPYQRGRVVLEFEGAGQKTDVYVYTAKVGSHVGGYDSWNVDLTDAIVAFLNSEDSRRFEGKIPLSIRCDNTRDTEMIPSDLSDFNLYGGIYRYLNLVYLPEVSVKSLKIEPVLEGNLKSGHLKVTSVFYNPADVRTADVQVIIKDAQGNKILDKLQKDITPLGELCLVDTNLTKLQPWHVDHPLLYSCEVIVRSNGQTVTAGEMFGFRNFEFVEQGPFLLNGKRLLLRGTHRHEDHAGVGAAMTEEQMIREMNMMKEMGVNFIRLGHYQQSEIILDLCDRLGILVWEEIPWCRGGVGGDTYREQARRMLSNMITQHRNHPSVIIWGLGNENDWPNDFQTFDQREIRSLMSELHTLAHQLDDSRKTAIRRCSFCSDIVDIYSPSIWAGWYRGTYTDYKEMSLDEMKKVKHFLHVEWGGDSHAGRHAETPADIRKAGEKEGDASFNGSAEVLKKGDWSESYIVKLVDWHLKEQETMDWLTGTAYWPFKDFSTPVRPENPVPYMNQKGVVERDFTKKESYYVFQSYWTTKPMVHIYGHGWPVRWGEANEAKEILVYSNCPSVELFVNGVSMGTKKRNSQDFPAAGLRWNIKLKPGNNALRAEAISGKGTGVVTDELSFDYQTVKWGEEKHLTLKLIPLSKDTVMVEAQLLDANEIPCLDSKRYVNFEIAGDGRLIQNRGTATGSRKVQAYNGRALIRVVRSGGEAVVAVKSEGIPTSFITIK